MLNRLVGTHARRISLAAALWGLSAGFNLFGAAGLQVSSDPPNASVSYRLVKQRSDGADRELASGQTNTPALVLKKFSLDKDERLELGFGATDYAPLQTNISFAWFQAAKATVREHYQISVRLEKLRDSVPVQLVADGATFFLDGQPIPAETSLRFSRSKPGEEWLPVTITAQRSNYAIPPVKLTYEELTRGLAAGQRAQVLFTPEVLREAKTLQVYCNQTNALVGVGTNKWRLAEDASDDDPHTLSLPVLFQRETPTSEWNKLPLEIEVPNFEWAPKDQEPQPRYATNLVRGDWQNSSNLFHEVVHFRELKVVPNPVHEFNVDNQAARLVKTTNVHFAAFDSKEASQRQAVPIYKPISPEQHVVLARLGALASQKRVFFAVAQYRYDATTNLVLKGSTISYVSEGGRPTQVTTKPELEDTDPFVLVDEKADKPVAVYYSSLEDGVRCIKRVSAGGGIPYPLTREQGYIDTEPAVSEAGRLAFTRRVVGAPVSRPPEIRVQAKDGEELHNNFGPLHEGRHASWSPKGKWIAFVDTKDALCLADPDSNKNPQPLVDDRRCAWPTWDPAGTKVYSVYFAAETDEVHKDRRQIDLFRVTFSEEGGKDNVSVGKPERLTENLSLDSVPACTSDGRDLTIYFLSNRGAPGANAATLGIYRLLLTGESSS